MKTYILTLDESQEDLIQALAKALLLSNFNLLIFNTNDSCYLEETP